MRADLFIQRRRLRGIGAGSLVAVGLLAGLWGLLPTAWLAPLGAAGQAALNLSAPLGVRIIPAVMGLALALMGIILLARRGPQPPIYRLPYTAALAPAQVYLDLENQSLTPANMAIFLAQLKQVLGGMRADCFFYMDAARTAHLDVYQLLWRHGFRPVDVPHKHLGVHNVTNIVDMALALHAYERALAATAPQRIILITSDQGFLPLIYQLRYLGHSVSVWGQTLNTTLKSLTGYLGVEVYEYGALFQAPLPPPLPRVLSRPVEATLTTALPIAHFPPTQPAAFSETVTGTLRLLREFVGLQSPRADLNPVFRGRLGMQKRLMEQVGFAGSGGVSQWLVYLNALGAILIVPQGLPKIGQDDVDDLSRRHDALLDITLSLAQAVARDDPKRLIHLADLHKALKAHPALKQDDLALLRAYALGGHHHLIRLLICARALGKIANIEQVNHDTVRVTWQGE